MRIRKREEGSKENKKGEYNRGMKRTAEVKRAGGKRKKMEKARERMGFCGGGCDGFVGHVSPGCQGAPVW